VGNAAISVHHVTRSVSWNLASGCLVFRHKVFKMILSKGKITEDMVDMLMKWRHSGFNVFCGSWIQPGSEEAMEKQARYIIRASFS